MRLARRLVKRIRKLPPRVEEEDAVMDAVTIILEKCAEWEVKPHPTVGFDAWVYVQSLGNLRDKYKKLWRRLRLTEIELHSPAYFSGLADRTKPQSDDRAEESLDLQAVRLAVECLPKKQQEVVSAYYFEHKTQETIATERGISQPAVHRILQRALDRLRRDLLGEGSDLNPVIILGLEEPC